MVRWCSSTTYYSFLLIDHILKVGDSSDGRIERGSESEVQKEVLIKDEELAKEVRNSMNNEFIQKRPEIHMVDNTGNVRLYMEYIQEIHSISKHQKIYQNFQFPTLPKGSQIQNLAMSCHPDLNNEDWVVAVKFSGSQLRLYRHKDPRWIDIKTTHESISPYSSLMFSKKDQRFYVPTPGCKYLCSFDFNFKEKDKPEFVEVRKKDFPKYELYEWEEIHGCTRTDHMVESPSGEQFLISWYYEDEFEFYKGLLTVIHKTRRFMVFKEDEELTDKKRKFMSYTEDIGDLCTFLGRDEAFCIRASSYPGLKPNCIYFVGHNYGVYDITTQTCTLFFGKGLRSIEFPYWPHPLSLTPY
ncbi:unnamed protein product [Arabis nemorensis]|uniref:KIB1-4 beta-propeller domain-containing protein n=1 Tax=Arabis nemorensis TaxID=586526 RepID=A0A565C386_9BRAS|nr:unnamed protein product [Arabis nemorensis]